MAEGDILIGRGPDGTNTRVNKQGVGVPFGTPSKASLYNPGTLAERLAIKMMQERARQRVRGGGRAQFDTYAQVMAEWNTAQAQANQQLELARKKFAASGQAKNKWMITDEFSLDDFMPDFLRGDRGRSQLLAERRNKALGAPTTGYVGILDPSSSKDPTEWRIAGPDPLGYDAQAPSRPTTGVDLALGQGTFQDPALPTPKVAPGLSPSVNPPAVFDRDKELKKIDPTLQKYEQLRAQWLDAAQKGLNAPANTGDDGDFGASGSSGSNSTAMGVSKFTSFQFLLVGDGMGKTVEKGTELYTKLVAEAMADPYKAGELMASMAAVGAYGGGSEKYVQDRLYLAKGKDGKPTLKGRFTVDDANALADVLPLIANDQANLADAVIARGGKVDEVPGFEELLAKRGIERQDMAGTLTPAGNSSGGGGGGGGYRGGGGGGGGGFSRAADPEQLKALIDGIARQRLGRVLTVGEAQEFANYFHSQEGSRYLDPESQAIAWIESRYRGEGARQQQGQYVSTLLKMLSGSEFAMGGGS